MSNLILGKLERVKLEESPLLRFCFDRIHDLFSFQRRLRKMFEGKEVAIVGLGPSILVEKYGSKIDSHDIVVHINLIDPNKREEYFGSRTDVRYLGANLRDFNLRELKMLIGKEDVISTSKNKGKRGVPQIAIFHSRSVPIWLTRKFIKEYTFELFGRSKIQPPRSGVIFVFLLLFLGRPSKISVYGFSVDYIDGSVRVGDKSNTRTSYSRSDYEKNHCSVELEAEILKHLRRRNAIKIY